MASSCEYDNPSLTSRFRRSKNTGAAFTPSRKPWEESYEEHLIDRDGRLGRAR